MDEQDQDAELTRRAFAFARAEPMRVISLAAIKLGRYWNPWPNADVLQNPVLVAAATIVELPVLAIITIGAWARRRDLRLGPARWAVALFLRASPGIRQLDAIPDPRRDSRVGLGGHRLDQARDVG